MAHNSPMMLCIMEGLWHHRTASFFDQPDNAFHRHWTCPKFQPIRDRYPELQSLPDQASLSLLVHAWLPQSPDLLTFRHLLDNLSNHSADHDTLADAAPLPPQVDIFTDGGCLHPAEIDQCVATWQLSSGAVPNRRQIAIRAEIWTAFSTLKFVAKLGKPARLWIDNQVVVQKFRKWMQGPWTPLPRQTNGDLWQVTYDQFVLVRHLIQVVVHIYLHNDPTAQESDLDEWAIKGNGAANK